MSGDFNSRKDLQSTKSERRPQIFVNFKMHHVFTWIQLNGTVKRGQYIFKNLKIFISFMCGRVQLLSDLFLLLLLILHSLARFEHVF